MNGLILTYRAVKKAGYLVRGLMLTTWLVIVFTPILRGQSADNSIRRCFIILHDLSAPFENRDPHANDQLYSILDQLFANEIPKFANANTILLDSEQENGVQFFDPKRDNIFLYYFGLRRDDAFRIIKSAGRSSPSFYASFLDKFLHNGIVDDWRSWTRDRGKPNFKGYFSSFKLARPRWGNGYSLSEFAYPGLLTTLKDTFFNEVVVILLSDYLAGSTFGNKRDESILRYSAFRNNRRLADQVIDQHNLLKGKFYKIDYFDFAIRTTAKANAGNRIFHGIKAFKIKPHAGSAALDNATIKIDSEIKLEQRGHAQTQYQLARSVVNFMHNRNLVVERIELEVISDDSTLFEGTIASFYEGAEGLLTKNNKEVRIDSVRNDYHLPKLNLTLPGITDRASLAVISPTLVFTFYGRYATGSGAMPVLYQVDRSLNEESFSFDSDFWYRFFTQGLPVIVILIILILLFDRGRPRAIQCEIKPFSDSYEVIDYHGAGRVKTPYMPIEGSVIRIKAELWLSYKSRFLGWKLPLFLRLTANHPDELDVYMLLEEDDGEKQIPQGQNYKTIKLKPIRSTPIKLVIEIKKNRFDTSFEAPVFIKFSIHSFFKASKLWLKANAKDQKSLAFHLGPKMSNAWMGLDPGTTGTCVTAGNHYSNLTILTSESGEDVITPSLIVFDKKEDFESGDWKKLRDPVVRFGEQAGPYAGQSGYETYRSIKKLLGYKNKEDIAFENGTILSLSGGQITMLLVREVLEQFTAEIERKKEVHAELLDGSKFNCSKAVVAVPNNFTAAKTQAMVDSIQDLERFTEIRAIPEAEAVMVYYIFNKPRFSKQAFSSEKVLIFDMGGATINASLIDAYAYEDSDGAKRYSICVEGKLGYGVGGDSIDYCLLQFLYGLLGRFTQRSKEEIDFSTLAANTKSSLSRFALEFKIDLISRFESPNEDGTLFRSYDLIRYLEDLDRLISSSRVVRMKPTDEEEQELELAFSVRHPESFFESELFRGIIYDSVHSVVSDLLETQINEGRGIDTVIYSGRSTLFPGIKETVREVLLRYHPDFHEIILETAELKSAVAKGACLYGLNNNAIEIDNRRTNGHFGIVRTLDAGIQNFLGLIKMGEPFNAQGIERKEDIAASFNLDANQVRFLQVLGADPQIVLENAEKHKYSTLARIDVSTRTEKIGMSVSQNDQVICRVKDANDQMHEAKALVSDEDIKDANDEHYTWML